MPYWDVSYEMYYTTCTKVLYWIKLKFYHPLQFIFQTTSLYSCGIEGSRTKCSNFTFTWLEQDGRAQGECLLEVDQNTPSNTTDISQFFSLVNRDWTELPSSTSFPMTGGSSINLHNSTRQRNLSCLYKRQILKNATISCREEYWCHDTRHWISY